MPSSLRNLWRNVVRRRHVERDLDDELRAMYDLLVDEKVRAGLGFDEARRAAGLELGGVEAAKEQVRDVRAGAIVDELHQDLRYAVRLLRRNPVFALTAALSLAIGIGATTTIFSIANGLLLRVPGGVADPSRVVEIFHTETQNRLSQPVVPYQDYLDFRRRTTTLEGTYAYALELTPVGLRLPPDAGAERVFAGVVSVSYFNVLGVSAEVGRVFGSIDRDDVDASPVVVLSHDFWARRFNADRTIVGRTVWLNSRPFTVVGVAREDFRGMSVVVADLWAPVGMVSTFSPATRLEFLQVMIGGRLKPGVLEGQAAAETDAIGRAISRVHPPKEIIGRGVAPGTVLRGGGESLGLVAASPVPGTLRLAIAGFLALLMGLVSIVLVIACANIAGVLLARATARRKEIAVRLAIGASRGRLVRQLLTETLVLFAGGAIAGLALARVMTTLLMKLLPVFALPVGVSLPLDARVTFFALVVSMAAALLSGLAPALQSSRSEVVSALKSDQGPADRLRLRSAFVVAQIAFSILLVVAAGLLARAQARTIATTHGFDSSGVEVASIDLGMAGYTPATGPPFARELVARVRQLPGVEQATLADRVPDSRLILNGGLIVPGVQPSNGQSFFAANWLTVEPGFFATLKIPIAAGRDFTDYDRATGQPVVILAESTARRFWPGQNPIGRVVMWQGGLIATNGTVALPTPLMVVGIARDLRMDSARRNEAPLAAYVPLQQRYTPQVTIFARTTRGQRLANEIRSLVTSMNPSLPIITSQTLENAQAGPVEIQLRVAAAVSGTVGAVGLLLAAIGIYGVTAYAVTRRTREIGVRIALGAGRRGIVRMVLRGGLSLVAIGSAIGLAAAAGASRLLTTLLFGVPPLDPIAFGGAALLFGVVALIACSVPVRRAVNIDPTEALRYE
jgi:putative ABC transport system permease protein